jgi:hypothetical protein
MKNWALKTFRWWCAYIAQWFKQRTTKTIPILRLKNMDRQTSQLLESIGVYDRTDLVQLGALEAYQQIKQTHPQTNVNLVLMLHGAIANQSIEEIPNKQIAYLLTEAAALQQTVP